jgi:hypothetical protein
MASYRGRVAKKTVNQGSRSERKAVVLETEDQGSLVIRRPTGNPFSDPVLDRLVGSEVELEGELYKGQLFVKDNDIATST